MSETVAYVLKAFPRMSETFIASEVYRLEQQGLALRLFIIKRGDEAIRHGLVDRIRSPRVYLPDAPPSTGVPALRWFARHGWRFVGPAVRQAIRSPRGVLRAAAAACGHAWRTRARSRAVPATSPLKEFLQAAALADGISRAGDVRHIHAHFCHTATTVAWLASMMTALPLSFTAHAKDAYCEALNPAGLLERKLRAARFVVTCTEATRAYLQARTSTRVHCLYHGLDVEFAQMCLSRAALPREAAGPVRALAVGRLVAKKGLDVFIEACALLRARGLDLEARIVGEPGEHEAALRALVARDGLQRQVVFTGAMSREALFEEFQRATVFCLPCRVLENGDRDGIPNVVAEAMACGVPVVTTGVGGIAELVVHEVSGLLVPPDDAASVADAILRVHADARLRERVCRGARARIRRRFDGDATAGRLAALLQGAAA